MKVDVLNKQGQPAGRQIELPEDVFGITPNEHVLYLAVKQYLAGQRTGTHKAKGRNEISGSTRKIKKQKGTGGARAGSIKNPLFRGGGRIFGPQPRDYDQKMNKKVKNLAKKSALSVKAAGAGISIIEDFNIEQPKTKQYVEILNNLGVSKQKSLFIVTESDKNTLLSSRNLKNTSIAKATDLNVYDIMNADKIIISEKSVETIVNQLANN